MLYSNQYFFYPLCLWSTAIALRNILSLFNVDFKNNLILETILPVWSVFCPKPINSDIKIYFRDLYICGKESELKEIYFYNSLNYILYNPLVRQRKLIYNLFRIFNETNVNSSNFIDRHEYQCFKLFLSELFLSENTKTRQIIIVRTYGYVTDKERDIELIDYIQGGPGHR